jgi:hypothetical protein
VGRQVRGRVPPRAAPHGRRRAEHGQLRAQHKR